MVVNVGRVEAQDDAAADLAKALDAWDHRKVNDFSNTIPFEKAVLRAAAEAKIAEAFATLEPERQVEVALSVAALATDAVRAELKKLAANDAVASAGAPHDVIRAALVRAGDPGAVAELKKGHASKDSGEVAKALLTAGDARAVEFVGDAATLAADSRVLATSAVSRWSETRTTKSADGLSTTSETVPVNLKTVGEVALEAACRMGASTLPDSVTWWYEIEKEPRFGRGADAVKRLRQFAAADAKAAKAKAIGGFAAVAAVQAALRPGAPEMAEWKLTAVAFDRGWTIEYRMGEAAGAATVDATGRVTRR
jgi:hypothetical protein